jgi:chemotaxis response regulator CheB
LERPRFNRDAGDRTPDMPQSATANGCIDFILSPEEIAQEIRQIASDDLIVR